jgi:hypothetical protein
MADRAHSTRLAELEERNEAVNAFKHARAVERAIEEIGNQHQRTKEQLDGDGVPEEDPLRNPKFYAELVRDGCIFCGKQESHWLFKVRYTERLWAGNAVPACPLCQERAEHYQDVFSFEEMSLIGQTIQFIRLNRANKGLPEIVTKKEIDETQ